MRGLIEILPDTSGRGTIRRMVEGSPERLGLPLRHFVVPLPIEMGRM